VADNLGKAALANKLNSWVKRTSYHPEDYICKVEIVAPNSLNLLYFPKPDKVKKLWDDSYVQQAKIDLLGDVKRDNPEVKV